MAFFRAPTNRPPRDLLATLRETLRKLEADPDPTTPAKDNLKRILLQRITTLESEASAGPKNEQNP
jgi:hypothetical protein